MIDWPREDHGVFGFEGEPFRAGDFPRMPVSMVELCSGWYGGHEE